MVEVSLYNSRGLPWHLIELHKLKRLSLYHMDIARILFSNIATQSPCLKDLAIVRCYQCARISLSMSVNRGKSYEQAISRVLGELWRQFEGQTVLRRVDDLSHTLEAHELKHLPTSVKQQNIGYEDWLDSGRTSEIRRSIIKNVDVEELAILRDTYFVPIAGSLDKVYALRDYVEDTEDYINMRLANMQNHPLQMGVMLPTVTRVEGAFVALTGVFGMRIKIALSDDHYT